MKDLLSKECYCYKIHTLLMKGSSYPFCRQTPLIPEPKEKTGRPISGDPKEAGEY